MTTTTKTTEFSDDTPREEQKKSVPDDWELEEDSDWDADWDAETTELPPHPPYPPCEKEQISSKGDDGVAGKGKETRAANLGFFTPKAATAKPVPRPAVVPPAVAAAVAPPLVLQPGSKSSAPAVLPREVEPRSEERFEDMALSEQVLMGLLAMGMEKPSPVQAGAMPALIQGWDCVAHAPSGSGKTLAYAVPALERLDLSRRSLQVLIITPTGVLAEQVAEVVRSLSKFMTNSGGGGGVSVACLTGGKRLSVFQEGSSPHVVVGTPHKLLDLLGLCTTSKRAALSLADLKMFVLDEADEMLDKEEFQVQLQYLIRELSAQDGGRSGEGQQDVIMAYFSATMTQTTQELISQEGLVRTHRVKHVTLEHGVRPAIVHTRITVNPPEDMEWECKADVVQDVASELGGGGVVVFVRTKSKVDWLAKALNADRQGSRFTTQLSHFKTESNGVLIATNQCARGIDLHHVAVVINFDMPHNVEEYTQRVGRSGRFGKQGLAITIVNGMSDRDLDLVRMLERGLQMDLHDLPGDLSSMPGFGEYTKPEKVLRRQQQAIPMPRSLQPKAQPQVCAPTGSATAAVRDDVSFSTIAQGHTVPPVKSPQTPALVTSSPAPEATQTHHVTQVLNAVLSSLKEMRQAREAQDKMLSAAMAQMSVMKDVIERQGIMIQQMFDFVQTQTPNTAVTHDQGHGDGTQVVMRELLREELASFWSKHVQASVSGGTSASAVKSSSEQKEAEEKGPPPVAIPPSTTAATTTSSPPLPPPSSSTWAQILACSSGGVPSSGKPTLPETAGSKPGSPQAHASITVANNAHHHHQATAQEWQQVNNRSKVWLGHDVLDVSSLQPGKKYNGQVTKVLKHGFFVRFGTGIGIAPKDGFVKMKKTSLRDGERCRVELERIHAATRSSLGEDTTKFDLKILPF